VSGCGNAELLGDFSVAAARATHHIAGTADQCLERVLTRLAMVFVNWHDGKRPWHDSFQRSGQAVTKNILKELGERVNLGFIGLNHV
jgi:hypothetical protein